jgi:heat shock protein HslJ
VGKDSVERTLQVAPSRMECTGVAPDMCLQVRESSSAPWTLLHGAIEGFRYEPGFLYEIRIREEAVANPPADASSIRRILVSVVSKTPAPPSLLGVTWRLVSINGREARAGVRVTAVFSDENRVAGSAGCNRYFGGATAEGERLEVGLLGSTRMYCDASGVMSQESDYLAALEKVTTYLVAGGRLRLGPARGVDTLVFEVE